MSVASIIVAKWPNRGPVAENWGDKLNRDLVHGLADVPVVNSRDILGWGDRPVYRVIGSGLAKAKPNEVVWGSGFMNADSVPIAKGALLRAVRGPLSRDRLRALDLEAPEAFGDPAILYPLLYWPAVPQTFDYGVIQHYREIDAVTPVRLPDGVSMRYIDIRGGVKDVAREILSCRAIISSSLHGLICAHAYGIPAYWLKASDRLLGDGFKFRDYWSSIGHHDVAPITVADGGVFEPGAAPCEPAVPIDGPGLLAACPFISDDRRAVLLRRLSSLIGQGKKGTIFVASALTAAIPPKREAVAAPSIVVKGAAIKAAGERGDVPTLLDLRDAIIAAPDGSAASNMVAIAKRLVALDRVESAEQAYAWLHATFPDNPAGLAGVTRMAIAEENWAKARDLLPELFARFPDERSPALVFALGRATLAGGQLEQAEAIFAELRETNPALEYGYVGAKRIAERRKDPANIAFWDEKAQQIEKPGQPSLAAATIEQANQLENASRGRDALMLLKTENAARTDLKLTIKEVKLRRRYILRKEEFRTLESLARALQKNWPERIGAQASAISACLSAGLHEEARTLVEQLYDRLAEHPQGQRLVAWYEAHYGSLPRATAVWDRLIADSYTSSIDAPCPQLKPLRRVEGGAGSTAIVTVVRDEMLMLPAFLDHHRALGVRHFHVVDNASTDGTLEFLLAQPDVDLWEAADGFHAAGGGMRWVNALRESVVTHDWTLYLDTDELTVLPDADRGIDDFTARLEAAGYDGVSSFMLDMHPGKWSDLDGATTGDGPLALCPYFTADYLFSGDDMCPWFSVVGGVRLKRFRTTEPLRKMPLLRRAAGARYIDSHSTTPVRTLDRGCGLLHFKMLKEAIYARSPTVIRRSDERSLQSQSRHRRFAKMLRELGDQQEDGVRYAGWRTLLDHGLVRALA